MNLLRLDDVRLCLSDFSLDVTFEISKPVTGLFGPSGAGKTTLLEIIAGLRHIDSGTIALQERIVSARGASGRDIFVPPEDRAIGYVPQDLALFPHKNVSENLLFGARGDASQADRFCHLMEVLQLAPLLARYPGSLSGGEKQRVAIGRALMSNPKLLLLDEPLSNLDRALTQNLLGLLKRTASELNVHILYVTHDAAELAALCDEVLLLRAGKLHARGTFDALFEKSAEPVFTLRQQPG